MIKPWESTRLTWRSSCLVLAIVAVYYALSGGGHWSAPFRAGAGSAASMHFNVHLLRHQALTPLLNGQALVVGVVGGSISSRNPQLWHSQLIEWLNLTYPVMNARVKDNVELQEHTLINHAIPGTESDVAAFCLSSMFDGVKPDVLFVEYGYNDGDVQMSTSRDSKERIVSHPSANVERIARHAITEWGTAVILIEMTGLDPITARPRDRFATAGSAHLIPAVHYGLPIVDMSYWWHHFPRPHSLKKMGYYTTDYAHVRENGSSLVADLVAQELTYHLSFVVDPVPLLPTGPVTHAWRHLRGLPYHGEVVTLPQANDAAVNVAPLPAALYATAPVHYRCLLPRIILDHRQRPGDLAVFGDALLDQGGWEWGVQPRDGGRTRSIIRPGFATTAEADAIVFELPASSARAVIFYRRSWEPCAMAAAWTSTDLNDRNNAPSNALMLNGSWALRNTQMTAATVQAPLNVRSGASYYLFIKNTGVVTAQPNRGYFDAFFKIYGIGTT